MGLQVDLKKVYLSNMARKDVFRKNNSIINIGDNMTQEERKKKIAENKKLVRSPLIANVVRDHRRRNRANKVTALSHKFRGFLFDS